MLPPTISLSNKYFEGRTLSMADENVIADGKLSYNTSTDQLFVLYEDQAKQITDFIKGLSEAEIRNLENPDPTKLYISADTKYIMYYFNNDWNIISTAASFEQVQSDWNQIDQTKKDFIKNKPQIPVVDSSYNPLSANAQSGIGVASAISDVVRKTDKATNVSLGIVKPDGITITIDSDGTIHSSSSYVLPKASTSVLGGVKVDGSSITIDISGTIHTGIATTEHHGTVQPDGTTVTITNDGIISAKQYTLPVATDSVLGGVKVDNSTIKANSSGVLTVQHNNDDYTSSQVKRTGETTSRINSSTVETALLKLGNYKTKSITTNAWVENTETDTKATYPYVAKFTDTSYNLYSHPSWQINGLGKVPTSTERDEIEKIKEFYCTSDTTDNITLYATEQPTVALVLEIIGC